MKRIFIIVLVTAGVIVTGLFLFNRRFAKAQHDEIADLLPEQSLQFYMEFPHLNDSVEQLLNENAFFRHFTRNKLENVLSDEMLKELDSILEDPYFSDPSKRRRMFNEQIIVAGYDGGMEKFEGLLGIRGTLKPIEYYSLIKGMHFLKDEGFLIKEHAGHSYYEGEISLGGGLQGFADDQQNLIYIFNLNNCFFIASTEQIVHDIIDFQNSSERSVSDSEPFKNNKIYRQDNDIISWGYTIDDLDNTGNFRYFAYDDIIEAVSTSQFVSPTQIPHFEKLAQYYHPDTLLATVNSIANYQVLENFTEQYLSMFDAVLEDVEYRQWLDFIKKNWDGGYFLDLDAKFDMELILNLHLLFPLKEDVGEEIIEEIATLLESAEIQVIQEDNGLLIGEGFFLPQGSLYFSENEQLLGITTAGKPEKTSYTDVLYIEMQSVKEYHNLKGKQAGISRISGHQLGSLYEQLKVLFLPLVLMDPSLSPRLEFAESLISSIDNITGYVYYNEEDAPVIERITHFKAR